ncbi:hypothetical protein CEXT_222391 [Caerostris extrusa]|uniref:Uncharacterized protein n=1 Tax=Caerostris extrusa TaxID=172846 RepID=A0AAV4V7X3_CAEEX|nr:hypothetical protein CEXT_222391 [Caerostris extrusa]
MSNLIFWENNSRRKHRPKEKQPAGYNKGKLQDPPPTHENQHSLRGPICGLIASAVIPSPSRPFSDKQRAKPHLINKYSAIYGGVRESYGRYAYLSERVIRGWLFKRDLVTSVIESCRTDLSELPRSDKCIPADEIRN